VLDEEARGNSNDIRVANHAAGSCKDYIPQEVQICPRVMPENYYKQEAAL
jgi:hypothetical protein